MSDTEKSTMTIKEYAVEQHISQQAVYSKIRRNVDKLKVHIFKQNGKTLLDETAQEMLKPIDCNAGLIAKSLKLEDVIRAKNIEAESHLIDIRTLTNKCEDLRNELSERDRKITNLEQELSNEKAKTAEMEKRINELSGISDNVAALSNRLETLFTVLEETANSGMGKKLGSLLSGRY